MIDGANPLVMELNRGRHTNETYAGTLWIGGAYEELFSTSVVNLLKRHFVHLEGKFLGNTTKIKHQIAGACSEASSGAPRSYSNSTNLYM